VTLLKEIAGKVGSGLTCLNAQINDFLLVRSPPCQKYFFFHSRYLESSAFGEA